MVPPNTNEDDKLPVLIVLHGVGGFGGAMRRLGFDKLAAANSALVVYPDVNGGSWNDGRPGMEPLSGTPTDDVALLAASLTAPSPTSAATRPVLSIAGFSNGALMASRAACDMPDKLRSVVLVSGRWLVSMAQRCKPTRPLSVMVVFGTGDVTVPYNGGQVASFGGKARGQVASVRELIDVWRTANGCSSTEVQEVVNAKPVITASVPRRGAVLTSSTTASSAGSTSG